MFHPFIHYHLVIPINLLIVIEYAHDIPILAGQYNNIPIYIHIWLTAHGNDHSLRQLAANSGLCLCTLPSSVVSTDFGAHGCAGHVSATLNKIGW